MDTNTTPNTCGEKKCGCHLTLPILVILFGLNFLLGQWGVYGETAVQTIWPILVIIAGIMKITSQKCKCC